MKFWNCFTTIYNEPVVKIMPLGGKNNHAPGGYFYGSFIRKLSKGKYWLDFLMVYLFVPGHLEQETLKTAWWAQIRAPFSKHIVKEWSMSSHSSSQRRKLCLLYLWVAQMNGSERSELLPCQMVWLNALPLVQTRKTWHNLPNRHLLADVGCVHGIWSCKFW